MLELGKIYEPYGKLIMIGWVGERYYWFEKDGSIAMIPAQMCMLA